MSSACPLSLLQAAAAAAAQAKAAPKAPAAVATDPRLPRMRIDLLSTVEGSVFQRRRPTADSASASGADAATPGAAPPLSARVGGPGVLGACSSSGLEEQSSPPGAPVGTSPSAEVDFKLDAIAAQLAGGGSASPMRSGPAAAGGARPHSRGDASTGTGSGSGSAPPPAHARSHTRNRTITVGASLWDDVFDVFARKPAAAASAAATSGSVSRAGGAGPPGSAGRARASARGAIGSAGGDGATGGGDGGSPGGGTGGGPDAASSAAAAAAAAAQAALQALVYPPPPLAIDPKALLNVNIALSKLGKPPYKRIAHGLLAGDADAAGGPECVAVMAALPPELLAPAQVGEMKSWAATCARMAQAATGAPAGTPLATDAAALAGIGVKLSPAERFVLEVVAAVPQLPVRLSLLQFLAGQFRDSEVLLSKAIGVLRAACDELAASEKLRSFLVSVLVPLTRRLQKPGDAPAKQSAEESADGSASNGGGGGADIAAVRISLLPQLAIAKGAGGITLLEYVARKLVASASEVSATIHDVAARVDAAIVPYMPVTTCPAGSP